MQVVVSGSHAAVAVVTVFGLVDVFSVPRLRGALTSLLDRGGQDVVVDCAAVTGIDATGLGALVGAWRRARRSGVRFALARPSDELSALLAETGLDTVLPVVEEPVPA